MHRLSQSQIVQIFLLAAATTFSVFLWQGHRGFSLSDEGFLWYGAKRVLLGEVPIRDFMAYDPGRYYWSAAFMQFWGNDGIVSLWGAVGVFQALGLFAGLLLVAHGSAKPRPLFILLAALILTLWMFPRHKIFDSSLSIFLVAALSFLIERPGGRRYFLAGFVVGLAAVFGRNHGMYGLAGSMGVIAYLAWRRQGGLRLTGALAAWAAGVVIGYLPVLLMLAAVPGFAGAFWDSIRYLFEFKRTNLPLPVPWPWLVPFGSVPVFGAVRGVLIGLLFIAIVIYGAAGTIAAVLRKLRKRPLEPIAAATAFMALPYAHYAYSRADPNHLALGMFPFILGVLTWLANRTPRIKWPVAGLLCAVSLGIMLPLNPGWRCRVNRSCVPVNVAGDRLATDPGTAQDLALLRNLDAAFAGGNRSFIATPFWPGAYAALGRRSPLWEIYALLPRSVAFQQAEIARIKTADPGFVVVVDFPLDGRDELRFHDTHPLIDQYIRDHFVPLTGYTQDPHYRLYKSGQP
ncbi:MAG: hypothetical protein ACLQAT_19765 [Candidatus Binataceae bacterium]